MALGQAVRIASVVALALACARVGYGVSADADKPYQGLFGPTQARADPPAPARSELSLYGAQDDNSFRRPKRTSSTRHCRTIRMYPGAERRARYTRRPRAKILTLTGHRPRATTRISSRLVSTRCTAAACGSRSSRRSAGRCRRPQASATRRTTRPRSRRERAPGSGLDLVGPSADYAVVAAGLHDLLGRSSARNGTSARSRA